ncbi:uncharacterized protein BJX67DRAFT_208745 [Aspergillus lucknowensis]|uniref:Uncharacterized protein n=1 Tax=Aspergillus lucknowensis TaxID=176173 RepID=A0ABR4LJB2_9EURO
MSQAPRTHRASSSSSKTVTPSRLPISSSVASRGFAPTSRTTLPQPWVPSTDNSATVQSGHGSTPIAEVWKQEVQRRQEFYSEFSEKIRIVDGYEQRAISAERELKKQKEARATLEEELKSLTGRLDGIANDNSTLQKNLESTTRQLIVERDGLKAAQTENEKLERDVASLSSRLETMEKEAAEQKAQLTKEKENRASLDEIVNRLNLELTAVNAEKQNLLQDVKAAEQRGRLGGYERFAGELRSCLEGIEQGAKQMLDAEQKYNNLLEKQCRLEAQNCDLQAALAIQNDRVTAVERQIQKCKEDILDELEQGRMELADSMIQHNSVIEKLREQNEQLEGRRQQRYEEVQRRIDNLENSIAGLQQGCLKLHNREKEDHLTLAAKVEGALTTRCEQLKVLEERDRYIQEALDQLGSKFEDAMHASQLQGPPVANHGGSNLPSISLPVAGLNLEMARYGVLRKKGTGERHLVEYKESPLSSVKAIPS